MSAAADKLGTLEVALDHAFRLLDARPELAREQAEEILKAAPGHPLAMLALGSALRRCGDTAAALACLEPLARSQPKAAAAQLEYGLVLGAAGRGEGAIAALRGAVALNPELAGAWRALGDHLSASGDAAGADAAYSRHIRAATRDPRLLEPAAALCENNLPVAEALLRGHLKAHPTDVAAIRMLAEVAARLGRNADAESLLARCLELAPSFAAARQQYAIVLNRLNRAPEALTHIEMLLDAEPRNPSYRNAAAGVLVGVGEYARAIELYAGILAEYPQQAKVWLSYGHVLKTAGRLDEGIAAYRKSIELMPGLGEAYWSLANLKTFRFTATDIESMHAQLASTALSDEDRWHFEFALGKAQEDAGHYAPSFEHYAAGNRLRRARIEYSADEHSARLERIRAACTAELFRARAGAGCPAPDPIFIVGLPRAGSTLIEQILASHSLVEGTMELYELISLARGLAGSPGSDGADYPEVLARLEPERFRELGERYLARTRVQRKGSAPFFIDKMPNNFVHVGLIQLALPNARIIDARRHPLACCFSAFKQHFARGQHFSYSLEDLGRYYRDYVQLMAHFDAALPGRVHRVIYESMVEDTEREVRALLEYCGLPFEPQCLRFYENERAVRTASSEQVRQPIFRDGLEQWRHFEDSLGPLREALGPVLETYPDVPASFAMT